MATFQAPNLLCLSLTSNNASIARLIINSSLPFPKLRELRLAWSTTSKQFLALTKDILVLCTGLTCVEGNNVSLAAIARSLWKKNGEMGSYIEKMAGKAVIYRSSNTKMEFALDKPDQEDELTAFVYGLSLLQPQAHREGVLQWLDADLE